MSPATIPMPPREQPWEPVASRLTPRQWEEMERTLARLDKPGPMRLLLHGGEGWRLFRDLVELSGMEADEARSAARDLRALGMAELTPGVPYWQAELRLTPLGMINAEVAGSMHALVALCREMNGGTYTPAPHFAPRMALSTEP